MAPMKKIFIMAALAALAGCSTPTPENRCCEHDCPVIKWPEDIQACLRRMVNDLEIKNARLESENDILSNSLATQCKTADLVELERENTELRLKLKYVYKEE